MNLIRFALSIPIS